MRNLFLLARLSVMWNEFMRLNKFMFTKNHLQISWEMASATVPYRGRAVSYVFDVNDRMMRNADGTEMTMKRDIYDQILDFIGDYFKTYWRNIFVESPCTHPHQKVWVEYEGERQYGYTKQHHCSKCGGYLDVRNVDRYLPEDQRHPELIDFGRKPRGLLEIEAMYSEKYEEENRHIVERDMLDEMSGWD